MSEEKIVEFPKSELSKSEVSDEEKARRIMVEVDRLTRLAPGEWKLWYKRPAEQFGIKPEDFAELIEAQIEDREKKTREKRAEEKLQENRAERQRKTEAQQWREQKRVEDTSARKAKDKSQAFRDIIKLPREQHEGKLDDLAEQLDEDSDTLKAEFAEYCAEDSSRASPSEWDDESWPESVTTVVVLEELIARINTHIVAKPHEVLVIALWVLMAWVHETAAHYSVYLVATSPVPGCGKTTLIVEVVGRLTPRPYRGGGASAASIFHVVDREKPTLIVDNVDTLFQRKPEVTELYLNAWTRDIPVLRVVWVGGERQTHRYDVFCPKACSLVGTNLPEALLGRCLLIELWRLKPGETVKKVDPLDAELMEEFKTLQRKLARWSNDHAAALKSAKPTVPTAFVNRPADNWTLLWAIADLAGGDWAEQARDAAERLSQDELVEPSWLERLVRELWVVFVEPRDKEKRRDKITSAALVKRLTADLTSVWCDYGRGHRVTQREVAALLRKLHIHPRGIAIGKKRVKGYFAEDFFEKQVFERILGRDPLLRSREPAR